MKNKSLLIFAIIVLVAACVSLAWAMATAPPPCDQQAPVQVKYDPEVTYMAVINRRDAGWIKDSLRFKTARGYFTYDLRDSTNIGDELRFMRTVRLPDTMTACFDVMPGNKGIVFLTLDLPQTIQKRELLPANKIRRSICTPGPIKDF